MNLSSLDGILWAAGFSAHCLLFCILVGRRRLARFPWFSVFVAFSALRTLVLFCIWHYSLTSLYLNTYWCFVIADTCLQFALIWEIAGNVFRRHGALARDVRQKLTEWSFASILVAGTLTLLQQSAGHGWFQNTVLRANFFPSVLISELFVVMIVLSSNAGFNWKSHVAGIAIGLAAFNFPAVVIETVNNLYGFKGAGKLYEQLQTGRKELYLVCVMYWCFSMWRSEPKPRIMSPRMEGQVSALRDALIHRNADWSGE